MPDPDTDPYDFDTPRRSREALLPELATQARLRTALPDGVRFTFAATAERLRQLHDVVARAPAACPALELRPALADGGSALTLDVVGPEGTMAFVARLLGDRAAVVA